MLDLFRVVHMGSGAQAPMSVLDLPPSGPKSSSDYHFPDPIRARYGLRLKTNPNMPYFGNRTK